ncbi:hypothetical protein [Rhodopseudomonas palustris]|uniref:hypothetical protein n=1 Tax=Rhodopseudomonas palustris TaxID=1076 RepID=UPI0013049BCB|nr:hypothetical protein [Rhodopseudomonas palustris]
MTDDSCSVSVHQPLHLSKLHSVTNVQSTKQPSQRASLLLALLGSILALAGLAAHSLSGPLVRTIGFWSGKAVTSQTQSDGRVGTIRRLAGSTPNFLFDFDVEFQLNERPSESLEQYIIQTDTPSNGIRVLLRGSTIAIVASPPGEQSSQFGQILASNLALGRPHRLRIVVETGQYLFVNLDGARYLIGNGTVDPDYRDVTITMPRGASSIASDAPNWTIRYNEIGRLRTIVLIASWIVGLIGLAMIASATPTPLVRDVVTWRRSTLVAVAEQLRSNRAIFLCGALGLFLLGSAFLLLWAKLMASATALPPQLLPGFSVTPSELPFKCEVIAFAFIQVAISALIAIIALKDIVPVGFLQDIIRPWIVVALLLTASLAAAATVHPVPVAAAFFGLSASLSAAILRSMLNHAPAEPVASSRSDRSKRMRTSILSRITLVLATPAHWIQKLRNPFVAAGLLLGCISLSVPFVTTWYPVVLPNDYTEFSERLSALPSLDRRQATSCATSVDGSSETDANCASFYALPSDALARTSQALNWAAAWQGEPGRVLFHHSYIYVPAAHLLRYGFDRKIAYLYGYGNTAFHAALMSLAGGPSLSSYFNTVPIAELIGLIGVALTVLYVTRSIWLAACAYLIALTAFYSISFVAIQLAISFSPLRYLGLMIQISSIAYACRHKPRFGLAAILAAACFSMFWNKEYGVLGLLGQGLFLLSPAAPLDWKTRVTSLAALLGIFAAGSLILNAPDAIITVGLGLFNVGMPVMTGHDKFVFLLYVVTLQLGALLLLWRGDASLRWFRVCVTPVIGCLFIKYAFNPSSPHLDFVLVAAVPLALMIFPWERIPAQLRQLSFFAAIFLLLGKTAIEADRFHESAVAFRAQLDQYDPKPWKQLRETIRFVLPEEPILRRAEAITKYAANSDRLLVLSPIDHLLSFYANAQYYCGGFELLSNIATDEIRDAVRRCAARPNTIIVYDNALDIRCQRSIYSPENRCVVRDMMKDTLKSIMETLDPSTINRLYESDQITIYKVGK